MLPQPPPASQSPGPCTRRTPTPPATPTLIGVGIDTARYGHFASFLRADLQPAAADLTFAESGHGYAQLHERLRLLARRHAPVHFLVRLDAAGQYADNLIAFLHALATPGADAAAAPFTLTLSCGDPQRNKNYRAALYGHSKSDPIEARAAARFALTEKPTPATPLSAELRALRQVAGRLQATVRQRTRLINQFHHLLALTFPELALLQKDLAVGWVLELVRRYPTAALLAKAAAADLAAIPYLPHPLIDTLLSHARASVASLHDAVVEELIREQVRQLRDASARQKRLEILLVQAYRRLPHANHLDTIPGIGAVTAAILTAFIVAIDRFDTPGRLVQYFGTLPIEVASGVDRDGSPRGPKRHVMSRRGNDLVRRYLWMAALSAIRFNPAVRALYARVVKKHPNHKAVAVGHAMRKLLHLAFAIWKTGKPFDPAHYPWHAPAHVDPEAGARGQESDAPSDSDMPMSAMNQAAGLTRSAMPAQKEVTAARTPRLPETAATGETLFLDFAHLKRQLPLARVLDQLGLTPRLRGPATQKRCACPIHRGDARGRTFSANLEDNVFHCFDAACAAKGDVIDLWAAVHAMALRQAAEDLVRTFDLEPAPKGTEKRNG
jgi:transposase